MHSFCKKAVRRALAGVLSAALMVSTFSASLPEFKAAEKEPNLKVGILSDAQSMPGESRGIQNFRIALEQMKEKNIELLLDAGDVSEQGDPEVWANYYSVFEEVYPDPENRPEYLIVMGNHDYYGSGTPQEHRDTFNTIFHKEATNEHKVVKGYHFINITSYDSGSNYTDEDLNWLDGEIQKAIAETPDKPIFVIGLPHAADTVYGSTTGWGKAILNTVFNKYPQVVYFSGHSHYPLDDERSIYQDKYTAIGTSSLNYLEMEPGKDQGIHPEGVNDNAQAMYMELYDDKVDIERMDIVNKRKVKEENWVLNLPLSKDTFTYTPARADSLEAPVFDESASVKVDEIGASSCTITFDQAKHADFAHSYRIRVTNAATGKEVRSFTIFSDFYNGVRNMKPTLSYPVRGLQSNTSYRVSVAGIESFGKEGTPIVSETFTTVDSLVFDADFADGTPKDSGPYGTTFDLHGNLTTQDSDELGQKVMQFDGQSYVSLNMSDEQLQSLQNGFTFEVVFKLDKLGTTQEVIGNAEQAGICLEVTPSGNAQFWVYSENKGGYVKTDAQVEAGKYYHYVATYDGENVVVYLNGKETDRSSMTGKMPVRDDVKLSLGVDPGPNGATQGCYLNGSIAKVKIDSYGMTAADASRKYAEYEARRTNKDASVILGMDLSGGAIKDSSVYNIEAKPAGSPKIAYEDEIQQDVLRLDGSSYVDFFVSAYQMEQFKGVFTLETVFKLDTLGKTQDIFADTEYGGVCLEVTPAGNAQLWLWSQELGDYVTTDTMVEAGVYYHYLATYDGENVVVYLNGTEVDRKAMTGSIKHPDPADIPLCLGGDPQPNGTSRYLMTGSIAKLLLQNEPADRMGAEARYEQYLKDSGQVAQPVNKSTLKIVLDLANGHVENGEVDALIPAAQEQFNKALNAAQAIYDDEKATQKQVDDAWKTLMDVIHALGFVPGNTDKLAELVKAAEALNMGDYQDGVEKGAFLNALKAAQAVLKDENAMQADVDAAYNTLKAAKDALIPDSKAGDKTELKKVIDKAEGYDLNDYVDDGTAKADFTAALAEANKVYAKEGAKQGEIDEAKRVLLDAMTKLRLRADKSTLEEWLERLKAIDLSGYTVESANAVRAAISEAEALAAQELSRDDTALIQAMVAKMKNAEASLQKEPEVPVDPEDPSSTPDDSKPDDGSSTDSTSSADSSSPDKGASSSSSTPEGKPATGDGAPVAAASVLAVAAAGAWLMLRKRNQK